RTVDEFGDQRFVEDGVDRVVEAFVALQVRDIVDRPRGQVIEDEHLVAPGEQRLCEVRSDEAGAAGDEYAHVWIPGLGALTDPRSTRRVTPAPSSDAPPGAGQGQWRSARLSILDGPGQT